MLKTGCLVDSERSNKGKKELDFRDQHVLKPLYFNSRPIRTKKKLSSSFYNSRL